MTSFPDWGEDGLHETGKVWGLWKSSVAVRGEYQLLEASAQITKQECVEPSRILLVSLI